MTDFNLPPGCRVSDIPGNRPEDAAEEAFTDALDAKVTEAGLELPEDWQNDDAIWKLVILARDLGLAEGFAEGRMEAQIDLAMAQPTDEDST